MLQVLNSSRKSCAMSSRACWTQFIATCQIFVSFSSDIFPSQWLKLLSPSIFFPSLLLFTFVLYLLSYHHYLTSASHKWLIYWKLFQLPSRLQSSKGLLYESSWECTDFPAGFNGPESLVIVSSGATTVLEKTSPSRAACMAVLFPTFFS